MTIRLTTDHPLSITTDQPVSITTEGGETTLRIEATSKPSGLVRLPRPDDAETLLPEARPRCGAYMVRSGGTCARVEGHNGVHMNAEQIARKQAYNKNRAKERYETEPEYRENVKAGSRASHARRKGNEPATE